MNHDREIAIKLFCEAKSHASSTEELGITQELDRDNFAEILNNTLEFGKILDIEHFQKEQPQFDYEQKMRKIIDRDKDAGEACTMDYQEKYFEAKFMLIDEKVAQIASSVSELRQDIKDFSSEQRARTDVLSARIDSIGSRIDNTNSRIDNLKYWMLGTAIALFVGLIGAVIGVMQIQNSWVVDSVNRIESSVRQITTQPYMPPSSTPAK